MHSKKWDKNLPSTLTPSAMGVVRTHRVTSSLMMVWLVELSIMVLWVVVMIVVMVVARVLLRSNKVVELGCVVINSSGSSTVYTVNVCWKQAWRMFGGNIFLGIKMFCLITMQKKKPNYFLWNHIKIVTLVCKNNSSCILFLSSLEIEKVEFSSFLKIVCSHIFLQDYVITTIQPPATFIPPPQPISPSLIFGTRNSRVSKREVKLMMIILTTYKPAFIQSRKTLQLVTRIFKYIASELSFWSGLYQFKNNVNPYLKGVKGVVLPKNVNKITE